jgi:cathepsin B
MWKVAIAILAVLALANAGHYEEMTAKHIPEIMKTKPKWIAGYNQALAGKSAEELRRLNGAKMDKNFTGPVVFPTITPNGVPDTFDARSNWPQCPEIAHIRDQGSCGSCWAVSSTASMGDRLCIESNGGQHFYISDENVIDCCGYCGSCGGGYPYDSFQYWTNVGIVTGGAYNSRQGCQPYLVPPTGSGLPSPNNQCYQSCESGYNTPYNNDKHYGSKYYQVGNGVSGMQQELLTYGPITTVFTVYQDFYNYKSGIYHYSYGNSDGNHVVKIVGWGVEDNTPYWLVANSWGANWGMGGFFKIVRGSNNCGFETYVYAGLGRV